MALYNTAVPPATPLVTKTAASIDSAERFAAGKEGLVEKL